MSSITISVDSVVARERIERVLKALGMQPILNAIAMRLQGFVDESFRTKGRGAWAPLAWGTVAMRKHGGSAPLQDTGGYRQSWVTRTFISPGKGIAEIGTAKVPLAYWLEKGTGTFAGKGPYTIRVRNARVLAARLGGGTGAFMFEGGSGILRGGKGGKGDYIFFGKEVQHPGIPPRPVLPNVEQGEKLLGEVVKGIEGQIQGGTQ